MLEPSSAQTLARFSNLDGAAPAITVNRFGKGRAIYVATPAGRPLMQALYRHLYPELAITPGPVTPEGVYARVVAGRTLYVTTTAREASVPIASPASGVLSGKRWKAELRLPAYGADLLEASP